MQGNVFTVFMEDEETKEWGKLNKNNNKWIFCLSERKQIKKFLMSNLFSPLLEWRGFYRDDNLSPSQAKSFYKIGAEGIISNKISLLERIVVILTQEKKVFIIRSNSHQTNFCHSLLLVVIFFCYSLHLIL